MAHSMLGSLMRQAAQRMRLDFEASANAVGHNASKGTVREGILNGYLKKYMPRNVLPVGSGEVIDVDGGRSRQCDLLVVDPSHPPLYVGESDEHSIVPAECVYMVIEVKSNLTVSELNQACENILSVKQRPKRAFVRQPIGQVIKRYGRSYDYFPTVGVIFGYDGASLHALGDALAEWSLNHPSEHLPDSVWILGKGWFNWTGSTGHPTPYPEPGSSLLSLKPWKDQDILLPMTLHLHTHLVSAFMEPLDLVPYADRDSLGVSSRRWFFHDGNSAAGTVSTLDFD
ncbi:DUF6602 domain-containing protein [Phytoactinopolyspora halotolerans]|uniref:DUF6602 domain-containing protein n=1 Tax=Phytoactinopolyspora halotolerans TaxID=1981512 RepID=A0A6L9S907_9ACTN|nr:DUF6602 domain-containing protein [Phytoactinopolyspora halotolerans]NEE01503.1 hypothetical protein [Phytoactinopolyspora halotolerans]